MTKRFANWRLTASRYSHDGSDKIFDSAGLLPSGLYVHL